MATDKTTTKRKQQGPRTVKDKIVYLTYKGNIEGDVQVKFDPKEALDLVLADRDLKMQKVTIPRQTRKKADPMQALIEPTAQAA